MKNILIIIILLFLTSCSFEEESVSFEDKYNGWISREDFLFCPSPFEELVNPAQVGLCAKMVYIQIESSIDYVKESGDYWKTADETLFDGYGDCEDKAILMYVTLIRWGVDSSLMYLALIPDEGDYHCIIVVNEVRYFANSPEYQLAPILYIFGTDYFYKVDHGD